MEPHRIFSQLHTEPTLGTPVTYKPLNLPVIFVVLMFRVTHVHCQILIEDKVIAAFLFVKKDTGGFLVQQAKWQAGFKPIHLQDRSPLLGKFFFGEKSKKNVMNR